MSRPNGSIALVVAALVLVGCGAPLPPDVCRHAILGGAKETPDESADIEMRACVVDGWRLRYRDREKYDCFATCVTKAGYEALSSCASDCKIPSGAAE